MECQLNRLRTRDAGTVKPWTQDFFEESVGAPVLRRWRHGVTPTEIGLKLAAEGRVVRVAMIEAEDTIQKWRTNAGSDVNVGLCALAAATVMPLFIRKVPLTSLEYTLHFNTRIGVEAAWEVDKGELDVAIVPAVHSVMGENSFYEELASDELCVVAGAKSPLLKMQGPIEPKYLADQPWITVGITGSERGPHIDALDALGLYDVVPKLTHIGDTAMPIELLRTTDALGVMTHAMAAVVFADNDARPLELTVPMPEHRAALITSKESSNLPHVQDFCAKLREFFTDLTRPSTDDDIEVEERKTILRDLVTDPG